MFGKGIYSHWQMEDFPNRILKVTSHKHSDNLTFLESPCIKLFVSSHFSFYHLWNKKLYGEKNSVNAQLIFWDDAYIQRFMRHIQMNWLQIGPNRARFFLFSPSSQHRFNYVSKKLFIYRHKNEHNSVFNTFLHGYPSSWNAVTLHTKHKKIYSNSKKPKNVYRKF